MERKVSYEEIINWINSLNFENFDIIVAVARGGLVPAAMISERTGKDLKVLWINLRGDDKKERYEKPKLLRPVDFEAKGKRILLVDDVSKTGKTLSYAKEVLKGAKEIKTLLLSGKADYSLVPSGECIILPWTSKRASGG